jgi:beta-lactamase regulating signal transducer with metallopeptidase domain
MLAWMLLAMMPAIVLCVAALLAEQAARQRTAPTRCIWLAALAASILLPIAGPLLLELLPVRVALPPLPHALTARMDGGPGATPTHNLDALARSVWLLLSLITVCAVAGGAGLLARRARAWGRTQVGGTVVRVAPRSGPAVFGWWRPQIVLPVWLLAAPARQRELALAHEQSHLKARDPQLLALSFALVAIMPWNLPLWWQLHRLRCAIEVDCDQRVLGGGGDLIDYGETLIELSQRQYRHAGLLAAAPHSQSLLERRIRIMSTPPRRWSRTAATVLAGLAVGVVALAAELTPPAAPAPPPARIGVPAVPALPAMPAMPAVPALPALAALPPKPPAHAAAPRDSENASEPEDPGDANAESASAIEQAEEARQEAEQAEADAREAKRDAEQQMQEAAAAKQEAEAAEAEAHARKLEAEAAAQAARAQRVASH